MINHRTLLNILKNVTYAQTISDIADRLYISQPYISKLLKEVEATYQVTLVERKTKPIHLTAAGNTMLANLQTIINEEDLLNERLQLTATNANRTINIIVTDPFSSELVSDAITQYYAQHPEHDVVVTMSNLTHSNTHAMADAIDIVIGNELRDPHFKMTPLTTQKLYLFISKKCAGFDSTKQIIPFMSGTLTNLDHSRYVGFSDFDDFQQFVKLSFKKEGLNLNNAVTVPTPLAALRAVNNIESSTTITTLPMANLVFPNHDYNLMPLPENFINLHSVINYRDSEDGLAFMMTRYLASYFAEHVAATDTPITIV